MVVAAMTRVREGVIVASVGLTALVAVFFVRWVINAHRPVDVEQTETGEAEMNDDTVRLERDALRPRPESRLCLHRCGDWTAPSPATAVPVSIRTSTSRCLPKPKESCARSTSMSAPRSCAGDVLAVVDSQVVGDLKASYLKSLIHGEHLRGRSSASRR